MKQFECGTLVPGCHWHTEADDSAEVVRRAADHLRNVHGESEVRPEIPTGSSSACTRPIRPGTSAGADPGVPRDQVRNRSHPE